MGNGEVIITIYSKLVSDQNKKEKNIDGESHSIKAGGTFLWDKQMRMEPLILTYKPKPNPMMAQWINHTLHQH